MTHFDVIIIGAGASGLMCVGTADQRGLYFIGEVVDVTGYLGGFNFQWAWSSGYAAGQFV